MKKKPTTEAEKVKYEKQKKEKEEDFDNKPSRRKQALEMAYQTVKNKC